VATFAAVNNGNGTATLQVRGVVVNCTQVRIGFATYPYNNSALDVLDNGPAPGVNSYTCTFLNSSGGTIASLSASADVTWPPGSVTALASGPYSGCSWSIPDDANVYYTFNRIDLYYKIAGASSFTFYTTVYSLSGSIGTPILVGYSVSVTWEAVVIWSFSGHPDAVTSPTGTGSTPPAPPPAPGLPTNLHVTSDTGTAVALAWTAPSGGATGYEVSRSINGGAYTTLTTQTGVTYTDNAPGSVRPITYRVRAYNSGAGGTTYGGYVTVDASVADSVGILIG